MQARILGTTMPVLEIDLNPDESVFSESGELSWMTASIGMQTHTQMGGGGGFFGVLKRAAAGASIFMTEYRAIQYPGSVSFASKVPGHIVPVELGQGQEYLVHRHGFLCATPQVTVTLGFQQSLGAGIFGGDGFLLQRIGGAGTAWLELSGELVQKNLAPGEVLRVHPGHVGAFQASVGFTITMVPGIKNMIFGADGIFLAQLVGPGAVWLQTLPISRLAHQIYEYLPKQQMEQAGGAGLVGGILGSIISGGQYIEQGVESSEDVKKIEQVNFVPELISRSLFTPFTLFTSSLARSFTHSVELGMQGTPRMNRTASSSTQRIRGLIVFAFAFALAIYAVWLLRGVLVLLYVSALFAVVLSPVVRATSRLRIGRWHPFHGATAIFFLLLIVAAAFTAFGFLALPPVLRDLQALNGEMPARLPALLARFKQTPIIGSLNSAEVINSIQGSLSHAAAGLLYSLTNWAGALAQVAAGFVLTLYLILEGESAYLWFLSFLPPLPRHRLDNTLRRAAARMEKWLIGQASLMLILGMASTVLYLSLGIRYAYGLGVLTGLFNIIPVLGAAVSIVLAMLVAAIDSWGRVLGVAIFFLLYVQIENSWLVPRIMRNRVHLPALAIFVALLLGSAIEGVVGAMVAIPTAVLVAVLLDEYLVKKSEE